MFSAKVVRRWAGTLLSSIAGGSVGFKSIARFYGENPAKSVKKPVRTIGRSAAILYADLRIESPMYPDSGAKGRDIQGGEHGKHSQEMRQRSM
jgi:hypothetical protein